MIRAHRLPDVPHRRLAGRLHEPAAAPVRRRSRCPKKVLVGPWNHALPDAAIPGPRIDYLREVVRWLDHWCKGVRTGIMDEPPVVVYMQRPNRRILDRLEAAGEWRAEHVAGARRVEWHSSQPPTAALSTSRARRRDELLRPDGRRHGRPVVGRVPVRAAGRPAAGRGALPHLHLRAASGGRLPTRLRARDSLHLVFGARHRLRGNPLRGGCGRRLAISSRREC